MISISSIHLCLLVILWFFSFSYSTSIDSNPDEIFNLPGAPNITFRQYSGYLNVDSTNNRNLFYWFVESTNNPASDPLVFWTNGGPGCSGLLGFLTEHGPFRPTSDGQSLVTNPYSWNQYANIIYIEAPAGVGFSYSDNPADYFLVNDTRTATDNYAAILAFMVKYPQYNTSDFYVTGESYGGHYVPMCKYQFGFLLPLLVD